MIKSENGRLRSYVQASVRDRDEVGFVEEARLAVARKIKLPEGVYVEWTGQFEHQLRARRTLQLVFPAVIGVIFLILYMTYHSVVDALLVMTSGAHRVDVKALAERLGRGKIARATPEQVRDATGQAIGGVAPTGHPAPVTTVVDEALAGFDEIWAAGGTPHTVFPLTFDELVRVTGGTVSRVD